MIDLHSHVLPNLDDGPRSMEQSVLLVRMAWEDGTVKLACTPHCAEEACPSEERLEEAFQALRIAIQSAGLPGPELICGAEMMIGPNLPDYLFTHPYLTYGGRGRYCLVELPLVDYPLYTERVLFNLQIAGLQPILAHPERNARLQRECRLLGRIHDHGVLVQVNAGSLLGHYGTLTERTAKEYLRRGWVDLLASDGHNTQTRPPLLRAACKAIGWPQATPGLPADFP